MSKKRMTKEELLKQYSSLPDKLDSAIEGLSETQLNLIRSEGKWSIRQIIHHLVDSNAIVQTIILAASGNSGCTYNQSWYDVDNKWVKTLDYERRKIGTAVTLYRNNHLYLRHRPSATGFCHPSPAL